VDGRESKPGEGKIFHSRPKRSRGASYKMDIFLMRWVKPQLASSLKKESAILLLLCAFVLYCGVIFTFNLRYKSQWSVYSAGWDETYPNQQTRQPLIQNEKYQCRLNTVCSLYDGHIVARNM